MKVRLAFGSAAVSVVGLLGGGFVVGVGAEPTDPPPPQSDEGLPDQVDVGGEGENVWVGAEITIPGIEGPGTTQATDTTDGPPMEYYSSVVCDPGNSYTSGDETCNRQTEPLCDAPGERYVDYFQRPANQPGAPWTYLGSGCEGDAPSNGPVLTPDMVLEAVRRIGLPGSGFEVPPATLVHYETTVYTEPTTFARTVSVVGFSVDVRAEPSSFRWVYDDGVVDVTEDAGAPYPSDAITHTWLDAHRTFRPRVDTTYGVRYRVGDGPWLDLGETLIVRGEPASVRIREATGMLADMR